MGFDKIINFSLRWEGGSKITRDPGDPGGTTKWGISQKAYPDLDIEQLTEEQAKEIYKRDYWDEVAMGHYDDLDMCAFDTAVNCGVGRVKRWLITVNTWHELIDKRESYYRMISDKNKSLRKYLTGWLNRTEALKKFLV